MERSTYVVLSFNAKTEVASFTHQSFRRFDDLSRALVYGAEELLIRDGVVIVRDDPSAEGPRTDDLQSVAACGIAEASAVALYALADYRLGRWPVAERGPERRIALARKA